MANDESKNESFLERGGELGGLTRAFDWSMTPVGPIDQWPQTLKSTVGVLLHSRFPMFLWWGDDMIQFYNDAYRPSLGDNGKHPKALGQKAVDCWPEIWETIYPLIEKVKTQNESFYFEDTLIPIFRNGKLEDVYWTFSYSAVFGDTGNIDGVLVVCNETTDKVLSRRMVEHVQKKIARSEANLRNIILQAPVAMCILKGTQHVVEIANERMLQLWGIPGERIIGAPIFSELVDARYEGFEDLLDHVLSSGETYTAYGVPVTLYREAGPETIYIHFVYEPFRDDDGSITGVMAVAVDVTSQVISRQGIEEIVKKRTEDLRKTNADLSQFAYITSHDLQEPARKISTFIDMLRKSLGDRVDERSDGFLDKIEKSSERMLNLIRDVLAFSTIRTEKQSFVKLDLNGVLASVEGDFELLIDERSAIIDHTDLPVIDAIPIQMSQLFGNLVSNALKFIQKDKQPMIRITWETLTAQEARGYDLENSRDYIRLSFADNGIGFNPENADQIFNIFQRLHGRSDYEGTGIGLAICKKVAENHGGKIEAISAVDSGATFRIILPVHQIA